MAIDGSARRIPCIEISRAMIANRAATIIGSKGMSLVVAVATKQDQLRCPGMPVVFYSSELMGIIGTNNPVTFRRARDKAIGAGWLTFIPGTTRSPGRYSAQIPQGYSSEVTEDYVTHSDTYSDTYLNTYSDTKGNLIDTSIGICSHALALASPKPMPITHAETSSADVIAAAPKTDDPKKKKRRTKADYPQEFNAWYDLYPRQVDKGRAQTAFNKAVGAIAKERKIELSEAIAWLMLATEAYAKSPAGNRGQYTPHPSTWLNNKRYDDNTAEWSKPSASAGVTYDPTAGANDPTFGVF